VNFSTALLRVVNFPSFFSPTLFHPHKTKAMELPVNIMTTPAMVAQRYIIDGI
jgi:hypothetical protein